MTKEGAMVKREISSLDYTICAMMNYIDSIFDGLIDGWNFGNSGFVIEYPASVVESIEVMVHPNSWPGGDCIKCDVYRSGEGWGIRDIRVLATHVPFQAHFIADNFGFFRLKRVINEEDVDLGVESIRRRLGCRLDQVGFNHSAKSS